VSYVVSLSYEVDRRKGTEETSGAESTTSRKKMVTVDCHAFVFRGNYTPGILIAQFLILRTLLLQEWEGVGRR
jgi:hypothetical protein